MFPALLGSGAGPSLGSGNQKNAFNRKFIKAENKTKPQQNRAAARSVKSMECDVTSPSTQRQLWVHRGWARCIGAGPIPLYYNYRALAIGSYG